MACSTALQIARNQKVPSEARWSKTPHLELAIHSGQAQSVVLVRAEAPHLECVINLLQRYTMGETARENSLIVSCHREPDLVSLVENRPRLRAFYISGLTRFERPPKQKCLWHLLRVVKWQSRGSVEPTSWMWLCGPLCCVQCVYVRRMLCAS